MTDFGGGDFAGQGPNPVAHRLGKILATAPNLRQAPGVAVALGAADASHEETSAVAALDQGNQYRMRLEAHAGDETAELAYWNSLTQPEQKLASAAGYKPVLDRRQSQISNFASNALHGAFGFFKKGGGDLLHDAGAVVGQAFNDASWVKDQFAHGVRAIDKSPEIDLRHQGHGLDSATNFLSDANGPGGTWAVAGTSAVKGLFTGDLFRAWNETKDGEKSFDAHEVKNLQDRFDAPILDLARRSAMGEDLTQTIDGLIGTDPHAAKEMQDQIASPEFVDAKRQYEGAKLSAGRVVANGLGLGQMHGRHVPFLPDAVKADPFDVVSGSIDGLLNWKTDPFIAAGDAMQARKVARYGMTRQSTDAAQGQRDLISVFSQPAARKFWDDMGPHLETIRAGGADAGQALKVVQRDFKMGVPFLPQLLDKTHTTGFAVKDAKSALEFLKTDDGLATALTGNSAFRRPLMPYRTRTAEVMEKLKPSAVIDFTGITGRRLIQDTYVNDIRASAQAEVDAARATGASEGDVAKLAVEGQAKETQYVADRVKEANNSWRGRAASAEKRFTVKVPNLGVDRKLYFDHPDAVKQVEQVASFFAPKYYAKQQAALFAVADEAGKRKILTGVIATGIEASGIDKASAYGKDMAKHYLSTVEAGDRRYATSLGADLSPLTGKPLALTEEDARGYVTIPDFSRMWADSAKLGVEGKLAGLVTKDAIDGYIQGYFKPSVLLRPSLAYRNAGEENLNYILQHGLGDFHRGRTEFKVLNSKVYDTFTKAQADVDNAGAELARLKASGAPANEIAAAEANHASLTEFANSMPKGADQNVGRIFRAATWAPRVVQRAVGALPDSFLNATRIKAATDTSKWATAYDWHRGHLMGKLGEKYLQKADSRSLDYLDDLAHDPGFLRRFNEEIMEGAGSTSRGGAEGLYADAGRGRVGKAVKVVVTDPKYIGKATDTTDGVVSWSTRLLKTLDSKPYQLAHLNWDDQAKALDEIQGYAVHNWDKLSKSLQFLKDAEQHTGSREAAARLWARSIYTDAMSNMTSRTTGTVNEDLARAIAPKMADGSAVINRAAVDAEKLAEIPGVHRPAEVLGQDTMTVMDRGGMIQELVGRGFQTLGDWTAFLSRQRPYVRNYIEARKDLEILHSQLVGNGLTDEAAKAIVHERAVQAAFEKTVEYVDNPGIRSQAAVLLRTIAPFYRAQEEFYARWAKTMKYNPAVLQKAHLLFSASVDSGFVQTDANGNAFFIYPFTGVAQKAVNATMAHMGLGQMNLTPMVQQLSGKMSMLNSGTSANSINPITSPIVSFPVQLARQIWPDAGWTHDLEAGLVSPQSVGANPWLAQLPTPLRRSIQAFGGDTQRLAAMKQAAAYLEYAGLGVAPDAPVEVRDQYIKHLRQWATGIMLTRVLFGMAAPAPLEGGGVSGDVGGKPAPVTDVLAQAKGEMTVRDEFHGLVNRLGYDEAMGYWIKEHPDLLPFTVGSTATTTGAQFQATSAAGAFMDDNRGLFEKYPKAASFLLPQVGGTFDSGTWRAQMSMGLRKTKGMDDFVKDLDLLGVVDNYFAQQKVHTAEVDRLKSEGGDVAAENESWKTWKDNEQAINPYLTDFLNHGAERQTERERTIGDIGRMLKSPLSPKNETTELFGRIVDAYEQHQLFQTANDGRDPELVAARKAETVAFDGWLQQETQNNLSGQMLYKKLFQYTLGVNTD